MNWTKNEFDEKHPNLARSLYLVEASSFAIECLREDFCEDVSSDQRRRKLKWECDPRGEVVLTLGLVDGRPVELAARVDKIAGIPVCLYRGSSALVDYKLVDHFFDEILPGVEKTDAMNFGHFLGEIDKLAPIALAREEAEALEKSVKLSKPALRRGL